MEAGSPNPLRCLASFDIPLKISGNIIHFVAMVRGVDVNTAALWVQQFTEAVPAADPMVSGDEQVTVAEEALRQRCELSGGALVDSATPHREHPRPLVTAEARWRVHARRGVETWGITMAWKGVA
jgi:hypothetical protein